MSLQVFLQAQMLGAEEFLGSQHGSRNSSHKQSEDANESTPAASFVGRCAWFTLLGEVLPRALLAELKLSRMLLGSSSSEQFLLVLAEEDIPRADDFLGGAAAAINELSGYSLRLVWASTENLGAWPVARKRLDDALAAKIAAAFSGPANDTQAVFAPFASIHDAGGDHFFASFAEGLVTAVSVGWSSDQPAQLSWNGGTYSWPLREQSSVEQDAILFPRRFAMNDAGTEPVSFSNLAHRADGVPQWGILRGDVDHFAWQLRRAASVEDHIQLSAVFKEFFAGELAVLCTLPDFWRKVTILYRGGDDFAVAGSWDALILLARELQRLFEKFVEHHLAALPGIEAKTISMAVAVAPELDTLPAGLFANAGIELQAAKASELGSFHLFGRTLEWKRLNDAEELKAGLVRLVKDFGYPPDYINDLAAVYREAFSARAGRRNKTIRIDKPWRTYMKLSRVIPQARGKEVNNLRSSVITNLVGKRTAGFKLRPSTRVGLEWARLAAGN